MSTRSDLVLNRLTETAAEQKATEIYFFPGQVPFLRIYGQIMPLVKEEILALSLIEEITDSLLNPFEKKKLEKERHLIIVKEVGKIGSLEARFTYEKGQLSLSFKILSRGLEDLEKAGMPSIVKDFTHLSQGVVFIVGPRDAGRSTLAASLLDYINKNQERFIATLEQPIRYKLVAQKSVIEQREVGKDVLSFKDGIAHLERRSIDVAMISSCQEAELIEELFSLAEAGTLVFTIFNAESTIKTINRIINFFPAEKKDSIRYLLSANLGGIIATRLVRRIAGTGRVRALEILPGSAAIRNLILENKINQLNGILELGVDGAISLDRYLADLASAGEISFEEGLYCSLNKEKYKSLVRR